MAGILSRIIRARDRTQVVSAAEGYDRWAETYDEQPDNAVLALESHLFSDLLHEVDIEGKVVLDVGCGTGRHWPELLDRKPARLIGVDVSDGMLQKLKRQYPKAEVHCANGYPLPALEPASCDLVVSTLALAHMREATQALAEWRRVLRSSGRLLVTDFHADAFQAGMRRTFVSAGETVEIEHHPVALDRLIGLAAQHGLRLVRRNEAAIDESVRGLFERDRALDKFEDYKGLRLVFGVLLATS